ncbi:hypothetical protein GCM10010140_37420 [Streptosporangium pseudovulgare]|uniref:Uncharacterized protein n=1 Tax=Streptosporangium pseudovulgare TaxID=35765 RepID=A0ABQ2QY47_9ACTN|nr:hypothetical protein GCM10010140_37420 [Streptosporangium pseudovulgare]
MAVTPGRPRERAAPPGHAPPAGFHTPGRTLLTGVTPLTGRTLLTGVASPNGLVLLTGPTPS